MRRCVGPTKRELAAALVEVATLAGWLALDGGDIRKSWHWHEVARAAAREAESDLLVGYVLGQESVVLAEAGRTRRRWRSLRRRELWSVGRLLRNCADGWR